MVRLIQRYVYAKENCSSSEFTESIEMLSYGRNHKRPIPHEVLIDVSVSIEEMMCRLANLRLMDVRKILEL